MSIIEFLEARIAEDETHARAAAPWATGSRHEGQPLDWSIHFDRWSPARVLAECAAKRAIIAECGPDHEYAIARHDDPTETASMVIYALAAVYKDHPDYQQEWAA